VKYRYEVLTFNQTTGDKMVHALESYGEAGWELVNVVSKGDGFGFTAYAFLKLPLDN
jgi:hypothetical protein